MAGVTWITFVIVCPFVFLAGLIDSIAGGGGLISLPIYMIAGVPPHMAIATNKLSSACGTALTTIRFIRNGLVNIKLAIPSVCAAILGSFLGARISLALDEKVLKYIMIVALPIVAFFVLNKSIFRDNGQGKATFTRRAVIVASSAAFVIGMYDGMYGPGTGTFLIIAFTVFAHFGIEASNAQAKVINLTTNLTSLTVFFLNGQVLIGLGIAAAASNMLGNYIGSTLVMSKGARIVKPVIILVLILLFVKIVTELFPG